MNSTILAFASMILVPCVTTSSMDMVGGFSMKDLPSFRSRNSSAVFKEPPASLASVELTLFTLSSAALEEYGLAGVPCAMNL